MSDENDRCYQEAVRCKHSLSSVIRHHPNGYAFSFRLNAFLEGFYDIIPKRLISIFSEQELELLVSGLPNIDIEDLKANAEYHKYLPTSLQVRHTHMNRAFFGFLLLNADPTLSDSMVLESTTFI